jgi:quinol monooxygenase YgiN
MNYHELIQAYFERSTAIQWYWTFYILVIGGLLGFSVFRQRPEPLTVILITVLYGCFAWKNEGAIEAALQERHALWLALKDYPASEKTQEVQRVRKELEPILTATAAAQTGVVYFHVFCDLLTIAAVWGKEWQRKKLATPAASRL